MWKAFTNSCISSLQTVGLLRIQSKSTAFSWWWVRAAGSSGCRHTTGGHGKQHQSPEWKRHTGCVSRVLPVVWFVSGCTPRAWFSCLPSQWVHCYLLLSSPSSRTIQTSPATLSPSTKLELQGKWALHHKKMTFLGHLELKSPFLGQAKAKANCSSAKLLHMEKAAFIKWHQTMQAEVIQSQSLLRAWEEGSIWWTAVCTGFSCLPNPNPHPPFLLTLRHILTLFCEEVRVKMFMWIKVYPSKWYPLKFQLYLEVGSW